MALFHTTKGMVAIVLSLPLKIFVGKIFVTDPSFQLFSAVNWHNFSTTSSLTLIALTGHLCSVESPLHVKFSFIIIYLFNT